MGFEKLVASARYAARAREISTWEETKAEYGPRPVTAIYLLKIDVKRHRFLIQRESRVESCCFMNDHQLVLRHLQPDGFTGCNLATKMVPDITTNAVRITPNLLANLVPYVNPPGWKIIEGINKFQEQ